METIINRQMQENFNQNKRLKRILKTRFVSLLLFSYLFFSSEVTFAHCDTMDGPLIADARKAIGQNNVNYVLKWVPAVSESEIRNAFNLVMIVHGLGPEAKELAEKYFFDTIVRIHRAGEGMPFTGVKPSGTPIDEKLLAADKSIEIGNLTPLIGKVPKDDTLELTKRFNKVISLKNFDVNNVEAGREYIEAYVNFFKLAEGEDEGHATGKEGGEGHIVTAGHITHIPWILSGIFFITTLLFGGLYLKKSI
jgi:hypothetical protein